MDQEDENEEPNVEVKTAPVEDFVPREPPTFEDLVPTIPPTLEELFNHPLKRLTPENLKPFEEWYKTQPHFPKLQSIDIVPTLNSCDYEMKKAKHEMEKYLTVRFHAPEIFKYRDFHHPDIQEQMKLFHLAVVTETDSGLIVLCFGWEAASKDDISKFSPENVSYIAFSMFEILVRRQPVCPGCIFIIDAQHFTGGHISKLSLSLVTKVSCYSQDAIPAHLLKIHVIRVTSFVDKLMTMLRPFLTKETRDKLKFYTKKRLGDFYENVPRNMLPEEYGGTLPSVTISFGKLVKLLYSDEEWIKSLDKRIVNESLRPGGPKKPRDVFGLLVSGLFQRKSEYGFPDPSKSEDDQETESIH